MKNKVYIIEDAGGKNFLPAKDFGELHVILSGREPIERAQDKIRLALASMVGSDYLLLVGSPLHIAIASFRALNRFGKVNFLVWNREHYRYDHHTVEI